MAKLAAFASLFICGGIQGYQAFVVMTRWRRAGALETALLRRGCCW
jgi:hypothetical protein